MIIGGLVINNGDWKRAQRARVARISAPSRDTDADTGGAAPRFTRRTTDMAAAIADRRGIAPPVRSTSTAIIFDKRGLDRREITDRRQRPTSAEPSSEFVAQAVAREGMLLDLRPDPSETRQARDAYKATGDDNSLALPERFNFKV